MTGKKRATVKPRLTDTCLIWTPHYYRQFALTLVQESPYIFSKFNPLYAHPINMDTFFDCTKLCSNAKLTIVVHTRICSNLLVVIIKTGKQDCVVLYQNAVSQIEN